MQALLEVLGVTGQQLEGAWQDTHSKRRPFRSYEIF